MSTATAMVAIMFMDSTCCNELLFKPDPFCPEALSVLYDRSGGEIDWQVWAPFRDKRRKLTCDVNVALRHLLDDGLIVTRFGMELSRVVELRYRIHDGRGDELSRDDEILCIFEAYFPTRIHRFFRQYDLPIMYRPIPLVATERMSPLELGLLANFRRDGFVRIERWHDLDMVEFIAEARSYIEEMVRWPELKGLQPLLAAGSFLRNLVLGYFGADASYFGANTFRFRDRPGVSQADDGWHHDGCGVWVKAFIYLHDVHMDTPHTLIVRNTHRMQWYPTTHHFAGRQGNNKLNESLVRSIHEDSIVHMLGRAGGGFLFDANMLHTRGVVGTRGFRDAVVLDFGAASRTSSMPRAPRGPDDSFTSSFSNDSCPFVRLAGPKFTWSWHGEWAGTCSN